MEAPASTFYSTTEPVTIHTQFKPFEIKEDELEVKVDSLACHIFKGALIVACVGLGIYLSPIAFTATFIATSAISFYYFSGYAKERAESLFSQAEKALQEKRQEIQRWEKSNFSDNWIPKIYKRSISYVENSIKEMPSIDKMDVAMAAIGPLMAFDVLCVASGILPGLAAGKIAADTYYSWKAEKECGPILADLKIPVEKPLLPTT